MALGMMNTGCWIMGMNGVSPDYRAHTPAMRVDACSTEIRRPLPLVSCNVPITRHSALLLSSPV